MLRKEKILGDSMYNYTIITAHMGWKNSQHNLPEFPTGRFSNW